MDVIDYRNAYVISSAEIDDKPVNTCRSKIQACCSLTDQHSGECEDYYLCQACIGEHMYLDGQIAQVPTSEVALIFNRHVSKLMKKFANHRDDVIQIVRQGEKSKMFDGRYSKCGELRFVVPVAAARELETPNQIIDATLDAKPLVARTTLTSPDGRWQAVLEYPVDYMNVHPPTKGFSIDVGPILYPDFTVEANPPISMLQPAYVLYKALDDVEFVVRVSTVLAGGGVTQHYNEVIHRDALCALYSLAK